MAKKGGQIGNTNATDGYRLKSLLTKRLQKAKAAEIIVEALVDKASDGDMVAIKEVFDRTEGKAAQAIELSGGDKPLVHKIEREIIDSKGDSNA